VNAASGLSRNTWWREHLSNLKAAAGELGDALRDAAQNLLQTGLPVPASTRQRIESFQVQFEELRGLVSRRGRTDGLPETMSAVEEELLVQERIESVLHRLDVIPRIQHRDQDRFTPWDRCLAESAQWKVRILSSGPEQALRMVDEFLASDSALNALVSLVVEGDQLTDEQWSTLLDTVGASYGREMSTAIARGKLVVVSGARA